MKPVHNPAPKPATPAPAAPPQATASPAAKPQGSEKPGGTEKAKPADLGLSERRRSIRPLPVPDAVESNGDTDWATFQALISDNQRI